MDIKIADVIKCEGELNNKVLVWKSPLEDFNCYSQLIVHESQEAVFFMNGQALDSFGPGRYTLETQNIPIISKLLNRAVGDKSPFHCEVYFVNKTEQMAIKWGTDTRIQYIEPTYGFPIEMGLSGEMSIKTQDARKLLINLVGTETYLSQDKLISYFRSFLITKIKPYVALFMKNNTVSIFEIDEHLTEFSEELKKQLENDFFEYGLTLTRFFVTNIAKPDGESEYEQFKSLHFKKYAAVEEATINQKVDLINAETEKQKVILESQAKAAKRKQEGYTYQQERGFDVAEKIAENEAVGQFTNMGVGLGTMAGVGASVGGMVGSSVKQALDSTNQQNGITCPKCGTVLPLNARFCFNCGSKIETINTVVCPKCGNSTPDGKFCIVCGNELQGEK